MLKRMVLHRGTVLVLCILAVLALGVTCLAAEYSATTVMKMSQSMKGSKSSNSMNAKVYMKGNMLRQEMTMGQMKHIVIVRPDKGVVWMLDPAKKTYMEMKAPSSELDIDPSTQLKKAGAKLVGKEKVNGYICDKYVINTPQGSKMSGTSTVWISKELKNQVKSVTKSQQGTMTTELTKIKKGKQPASLFELPKGYKKTEMPSANGMKGMGGPPPSPHGR